MKKAILFILFSVKVFSQTGIGTTTPDASAKLDVSATNKGFLPPRVTLSSYMDNTTILNPAIGLLIYNTGNNVGLSAGYYYWNGNAWATIATAGGSGSMAAEFGSQMYTAAALNITGTNLIDVLSFTLPSAGTWEVITSLRTSAAGAYAVKYALFDASGTKVANSEILSAQSSGAAGSTGLGIVRITTTGSAVFYLKANLADWSANACNVLSDANGRSGVIWQKISGNALVTGQSVDYVSVNRTTSQTVNTGDNIIFNTINSGNIPYNSSNGNFTLTAGKTYRLTGSVSLDGSNTGASAMDVAWKNAAGDILGNRGFTISSNYSSSAAGNGFTDIVYTPTINTTIALNVISSSASAKTVANYTYANITQIGSSAFVNPWILSGINTYNTTGNVGVGTTTPRTSLHIENGNTFGTDPSNTTSPSLYIYNNNSTSTAAHASATIRSNSGTGGNPYLSFDIMGVRGYSMGIDNADGDKFKIQNSWNFSSNPILTLTTDNRVGIGTTNPSAALHVASSVTQTVGAYGYLAWNGATGANGATQTINYSIQTDERIRAPEFNAISDARIKKDIFKLNTANQLTELNKLSPVNYAYIDQLVNGNKQKTGFIAQEVEQVNPQFVNKSTDFIPSVFALAKSVIIENGVLKMTTEKPHGFAKGDVIKVFAQGKKEVISTVESIIDSQTFTLKGWTETTDNVFIYGKKINDFRAIDFDQITALSVAAIQELSKQMEMLKLENSKLELNQRKLDQRLKQLESKIK